MADSHEFEPAKYLTMIGNAQYLEVKWRIYWFREVCPQGAILSELVHHDANSAIFKATVIIDGVTVATDYGSETYDDFRDFHEKASTKAIGRALALAGFGTQFTGEFDFGAASGAVVDSPVDFVTTRGRREAAATGGGYADNRPRTDRGGGYASPGNAPQPATPRQIKFIGDLARERGVTDAFMDEQAEQLYGAIVAHLNRRDASSMIERLQAQRPDVGAQPARSQPVPAGGPPEPPPVDHGEPPY
jgi:hypothetical protein